MDLKEVGKCEITDRELAELHYDFGLIAEESIISQRYYRDRKGKLWEVTMLEGGV